MIYNHILDVLTGRISPPDFIISKNLDRRWWARMLRQAELFDFGALELERNGTEYRIPALTTDEVGFFKDGLIPLPAPYSWYEFVLNGVRSAILVADWRVARFEWDPLGNGSNTGMVDGIWVEDTNERQALVSDDRKLLSILARHPDRIAELGYAAHVNLARYLTLMLNSRTTEKRSQPRGERPAAGNRHALPEHTVVTIVPERYRHAEPKGGHHASPRLHWRRSHLRQFRAPSGEVYHRVVIPRCLVGLEALGKLEHTYRVKKSEPEKTT